MPNRTRCDRHWRAAECGCILGGGDCAPRQSSEVDTMKRIWPLIVIGVIVIAIGAVWTLQGIGVLGGSAMSGSTLWAVIGPIVIVVGIVLIGFAVARRRRG